MPEKLTFEIGDMGEGFPWAIAFDEEVSLSLGVKPCPHCHSRRTVAHRRWDGSTFDREYCTCPRVVISENEGGNNITVVCLDCILEAAIGIETATADETAKQAQPVG